MLNNFKNDIIAGFSVFLIALPLCLGIAIASQFPPSAGILSAVIGGMLALFFGGSKLSIKGPAAGLIAITLTAVDQLGNHDLLLGYERTLAVGVVAALLQIVIALGKKAVIAEIIPSSVIHGMLAAIGIIIVSKQSYVLMGLTPESSKPLAQILHLPSVASQLNPVIFLLGLLALMIIIFWPFVEKIPFLKKIASIPYSLIILATVIPVSLFFNLNILHAYHFFGNTYNLGSSLFINLPSHFLNAVHFPDFSYILNPLSLKFVILFTLIGSIESLLTIFTIDNLVQKNTSSDANKDLLAIGIGNLFSASIGGLPMISEIVRSKANIDYGAKSEKANFFHGLFMLIAVLLLPTIMNLIPLSALAALLICVGIKLASPKEFIHAYKIGLDQFFIFMTTFIFTLLNDLLIGVISGIIFKMIFHIARSRHFKMLFSPSFVFQSQGDTLYVNIEGPLTFLSYPRFISGVTKNLNDTIKNLNINLRKVTYLDHTVLQKFQILKNKFVTINITIEENPKLIPFYNHPLSSRMQGIK